MKYLTDWLVMSGSDSQEYQDNYDRIFNSDKKEEEKKDMEVVADDACPHCNADLKGDEIPKENRESYGNHTHFSRVIGVEIQGVYDGALFWQCPDCEGKWHRFSEEDNSFLRGLAEEYIDLDKVE